MVSFVMGWLSASQRCSPPSRVCVYEIGDYRWRGLSDLVKYKALPPTARTKNNRRAPDRLRIERPKYWSLARRPATQNPITSTVS